jgi:8-oxo-dGTP pyrophosphatase MutT (NUDIX family)
MHRNGLLKMLAAHRSYDAREADMVARTRAFVKAEAACFSRSTSSGHITGSAWIVNRARNRALLVHHVKLGRWLQPGGHADGESCVLQVALREAREETGLATVRPLTAAVFDVDIHCIPERGAEAAHFHYDLRFLCEADEDEALVCSAESHAVRWCELGAIAQLNDEASIGRLVAKTAGVAPGAQP